MVHAKGRQELRISLRAVVYPHGEWWIAHCLELDVVAEGRDRKTAIQDLMDLCATQIETAIDTGNLESVFRPAPPRRAFRLREEEGISDADFYGR